MLVGVSRIPFLLYHHFILLFILGVVVTQGQISFQDTPYRTTLEEESPNGTYLLTVIAIDLAAGISSGSYSIVSNEFAIDALSGDLSTIAVIDRESPGTPLQFIFDVTFVSDDGNTDTSPITISIRDVNDNTPIFSNSTPSISIREYTSIDTVVFTANATDLDSVIRQEIVDTSGAGLTTFNYTVDNGRVLYGIADGSGRDYLSIDVDSGEVTVVNGSIDVDISPTLTLNLSASDGPGLITYSLLTITIQDINDNIPTIRSPSSFSITLSEAISVGTVLVDNFNSTDLDHGLNAEIHYSLAVSNQSDRFTIDPTTGRLSITTPLDRDTDAIIQLSVLASDSGTPPLTSSILITITLTDVNDITPTFSADVFQLGVREDALNGSVVYQFEAVDKDEGLNGTVRYFLSHSHFSLSAETGVLSLIQSLDRETRDGYNFTIIAFDLGTPVANTASIQVNITVLDVNDNSPIFNSSYFELHLLDTESPPFVLSTITAQDRDIGTNGEISYSLTPASSSEPFTIASITGVITLSQTVRYSLSDEWHNYTLVAMDGASGIEQRSTAAELAIRVHAPDANPPIFSQDTYNATVPENTTLYSTVLNVTATDSDIGLNGAIRYYIVGNRTAFCYTDNTAECGNAGELDVNAITGSVFISSPLDRDIRESLAFQVIAFDGGFPQPKSDTTNVTIYLLDSPDTPPQFSTDSINASIFENSPISTYITTVLAVDPDMGEAGVFSFRIDSNQYASLFVINSTTGELFSNFTFDRESESFYQLSIVAEDFALIPLASYLLVNITILDRNDNPPYLLSNYFIRILESQPIGTIVDSNFTILDDDIGMNAEISYSIVSISPSMDFYIESNTGHLYTNSVLNITAIAVYNICILTENTEYPNFNVTFCVDIQVLDGNFNSPIFSQSHYNTTLLESTPVGTVLLNVSATDGDFSDNNNLIYYTINTTYPDDYNNTFSIDLINGNISLTEELDREEIAQIIVTIFATDQPLFDLSRTASVDVLFYIGDVNEFIPYFSMQNDSIVLSEGVEVGSRVYELHAVDGDAEYPNNEIIYFLVNSTYSHYFTVDNATGEVYTYSQLDRELVQSFSISFEAADLGTPSLKSPFTLYINLSDINDNPPHLLTTAFSSFENQTPNYTVAILESTDSDRNANGTLNTIRLLNNIPYFEFNNVTGELVSLIAFDRETVPSYNISVFLLDSGSPALQSTIIVTIFVTDINDNTPVFDREQYEMHVPENTAPYTDIIQITATDNDIGVNAILTYSINPQTYFQINSSTGLVSLSTYLDFESLTEHILQLYVTDGTFTAHTTLSIHVVDVNDNPPIFVDSYQFSVKECSSAHTHLGTIQTTDADTYYNNTYTEYTLINSVYFSIHRETGLLKTLQTFNTQIQKQFVLTVIANNTLADPPRYSMTDVPIQIEFVTDRPEFSAQIQTTEIEDYATIGSMVFRLQIVDYPGINVGISYVIKSGNNNDTFSLNSTSGELTLQKSLDYFMQPLFALSIAAIENILLRNTTTILQIEIVRRIPFEFPSNYQFSLPSDFTDTQPFFQFNLFAADFPLSYSPIFQISQGNEDGIFSLTNSGALLVQNHSLLQLSIQPITFSINVTNGFRLFDETNVTIIVSTPSLIEKPVYSFRIPEDIAGDSFIGNLTSNSTVANSHSFNILSGNVNSVFRIQSGMLLTESSSSFDYELKSLYSLSVLIQNVVDVYVMVQIEIMDINEFQPMFASELYYLTFLSQFEYQSISFPIPTYDRDTHSDSFTINIEDNDNLLVSIISNQLQIGESLTNTTKTLNISLKIGDVVVDIASVIVTFQSSFNENPPQFNTTVFAFVIHESDSLVGQRLDMITATDPDASIYGELSYGLSGNHNDRDFIVDTLTGVITFNNPLDYERQSDYNLVLHAFDSGRPCYSDTVTIIITVLDDNDNPPVFQQEIYTLHILENSTVGTQLLTVLASDEDSIVSDGTGIIGTFGYVTYSLSPNDTNFSITSSDGVISLVQPIDRETVPMYNITIIAVDGGGLMDIAYLIITLEDINDNTPLFENSTLTAGLLEHEPAGTEIAKFLATDLDIGLNAIITYLIISGNENGLFYLNSATNALHANTTFDREAANEYTITIQAADSGIPVLTSTAVIEIEIIDINDNSPEFSQSMYNISVFESLPVGSVIFNATATDSDAGTNAMLYFSILSGNSAGKFSLNATTGYLYIAIPLDYESVTSYVLAIQVTDGNVLAPRSDNATLHITVLNANDNSPVFSQLNYTTSVPESIQPDTLIFQVSASDSDQGGNVTISYRLDFSIDPSIQGYFYIEQNTGRIFTGNVNFDFEDIPELIFETVATDFGQPPLASRVSIFVRLVNENDNPPLFLQSNYSLFLEENLSFPTLISILNATDPDGDSIFYNLAAFSTESECIQLCGTSFQCHFSIIELNTLLLFNLYENTSELYSNTSFDREIQESYLFLIAARDRYNSSTAMTSYACVSVDIVDVNDNSPIPAQNIYYVDIIENISIPYQIISLPASDGDAGRNAELSWLIEQVTPAFQGFQIHPSLGILTLSDSIDREQVAAYQLTITITDNGTTPLQTEITVHINITDVNDNTPVFDATSDSQTVQVFENALLNQIIIQINAIDDDSAENALVTYSLTPNLFFNIDSLTGEVYSVSELDYETMPAHNLVIIAEDNGSPSLPRNTTLTVLLIDSNDNTPLFSSDLYNVSIIENVVYNESILSLFVTDADTLIENTFVSIEIIHSEPNQPNFYISQTDKELRLIGSLDAEFSTEYRLTIEANNTHALSPLAATTTVLVFISDQNDNSPLFSSTNYYGSINEASPIGDFVIQLSATDRDVNPENSKVYFYFEMNQNSSFFSINSTNGIISLSNQIDFETTNTLSFNVFATDNSQPVLSSSSLATISVLDSNDNAPYYTQLFTFSIPENTDGFLGIISASDVDNNTNLLFSITATFVYNISSGEFSTISAGIFSIDPTSGELSLLLELDRETSDTYLAEVSVSDSQHSTQTNATIQVTDLNDNTPSTEFSNYTIQVHEGNALQDTAYTPVVTDRDFALNAETRFAFTTTQNTFSINPITGEVMLEIIFDRETRDSYTVGIVISDLGSPSLSSTTVLQIEVLDINDNIPMIPQPSYEFTVVENSAFGFQLTTFTATDIDMGINSQLHFFLNDSSLPFEVSTDGSLFVSNQIDFEYIPYYSFFLYVSDQGTPSYTVSTQLFITVLDLNDNNPEFEDTPLAVSISEYTLAGSVIFTLKATDIDSLLNGEFFFAINQGNTALKFSINEVTGDIITIDSFDFEINNLYELTVLVADKGTPSLYSTATLSVRIVDENDNQPEFSQLEYFIDIREDISVQSFVTKVFANDADSGTNGKIDFSIVPPSDAVVSINATSGDLYLQREFNFEEMRVYSIQIQATDNGTPKQSSLSYLQVKVSDVNEFSPSFPLTPVIIFLSNSVIIGTQIFQAVAFDQDTYGPSITYQLSINPLSQYVNINTQTGNVYLENQLSDLTGNYTLEIQAFDGDHYSYNSLTLVLYRFNTHYISFSQPSFYFSIPDNSTVGSMVAQISGENVTRFELIQESFNNAFTDLFSITDSGEIVLLNTLISSAENILSNGLYALNSVSKIQSVVTFEIIPIANTGPVFSMLNYHVRLSEALPIDTTFLTVLAVDYDLSDQGIPISYSISVGNEFGFFSIDGQTGKISINQTIDREITPQFELTVQAIGDGVGLAYVDIDIDDVNDNSPVFTDDVPHATIPSDTPIGSTILKVTAIDSDMGRNGEVSYSIVSQTISGLFILDMYSGDLTLNASLLAHTFQSYSFYISSADNGIPVPLSTEIQVYITIIHPNQFSPVFLSLETNTTIPETAQIGSLVTKFIAQDPDTNSSSVVYFTLSDLASPFSLNNKGELYLTETLDYLQASEYQLTITAADSGIPTRYATLVYTVYITDINNHMPMFSQVSYATTLLENAPIQTPIITVNATDLDAVSVTYILSLNSFTDSGSAIFSIDSTTGVISLAIPLDFETTERHELLVTARDHGYPISLFNSVTLTVSVDNVNDNAPVFIPSSSMVSIPRLFTAGRHVITITAFDLDSVTIAYSIQSGNVDSLFQIDTVYGIVTLVSDVGETAQSSYTLQLLGFDGELSSIGLLQVEISDNASYCYDGLCSNVLPSITCTTAGCTVCPADYTLSTTSTFCYSYYCSSSNEYLCEELQQTRDCIPFSLQCNGVCISNSSICPSDNLCYSNSIASMPCDDQDTVCLEGYVLVQNSTQDRVCILPSLLPPIGQICASPGKVYCEEIDACQNLQNNPSLCQRCSMQEFQCSDTNECVPSMKMCCGTTGYFCNITDACVNSTQTCPPISANIPPTIPSKAELLSVGSVIGLLLGDGIAVGVDTENQELGIVVIAHYPAETELGYWQYVRCRDAPSDAYGHCNVIEYPWLNLPTDTSIDNAFVLPPNHRIRFIRSNPTFEGAAWLRLHTWDGFREELETQSLDSVRDSEPHFIYIPPFKSDSAYSREYMYFVSLFNPVTSLPTFLLSTVVSFPDIQEDYSSLLGNGVLLSELMGGIEIPNLYQLSTEAILGLPATETASIQNSLPTSSITSYFSAVDSTNLYRVRRLSVSQGVLISNVNDNIGEWQISLTGRQSDWYPISLLLGSTHTLLFVPITAGIRFIPNTHTHGTTTISLQPWDGTVENLSIQTKTTRGITYSLAVSLQSQTNFALGTKNDMSLRVNSAPDNPIVKTGEYSLPTIPYFIQYQRVSVFVVQLEMSITEFEEQKETLREYLSILFHSTATILYSEPLNTRRSIVSFQIEERQLTLNEVMTELDLRKDVLINFGFNITDVSQDIFVGQGYGCFKSSLYGANTGESVGTLTASNGLDADGDSMGLAVTLANRSQHGIWQYYRSDRPSNEFNPLTVNWITFPTSISDTNAFLLRPSDWIRFTPYPRSYWPLSSAPQLTIRLWDTSAGNLNTENDFHHANTDPYTTTVHSTVNPIGLFSSDPIIVSAHRQSCTGSADSTEVYDACCLCGGSGVSCSSCDSHNVSTNAQYDNCGECGGNSTTCLGCDLVPFVYSQTVDSVCRSNPSPLVPGQVTTYIDCAGTPFGLAIIDDCSVCTEGITDREYNNLKDCNSVCGGTALVNLCGVCAGGTTGLSNDHPLDCRGICDGDYSTNSCGVCQHNMEQIDYKDCVGQCYGTALTDQCNTCYGGTSPIQSADTELDQCNVCGGDGTSCIGCDGNTGTVVDHCGDCNGDNCGCVKVTKLTPTVSLTGTSSYIRAEGAGFFFKPDATSPSTHANGSYLPLCGGIRQYPNSDLFVPVYCIFTNNEDKEINLRVETYYDQSSILCKTPDEVISGDFYLLIQFEDILNNIDIPRTPLNTSVPLRFFDNSVHQLSVVSASLDANLVGVETELFFDLVNFEYFPQLSCIIHSFSSCDSTFNDDYVISALFIHSGKLMCVLPPVQNECQITLSISINNQIAGIIPTRNIPFAFLHPEPLVLQSRLQANLASILLQFDQSLFLTNDISNGCSALFDSSTLIQLASSQCYFIGNSNSYIIIQLSTDALLTHDSLLTWKPNSVYGTSQTYTFPLSTPTALLLPNAINNPVSIILGPAKLPLSGSTYFSAHLSYTSGYKPFVFNWDIRPANLDFDLSTASMKLSQLALSSDTIVLDSSDFETGGEYILILSVMNSFGISSLTNEFVFTKSTDSTHSVIVVSNPVDLFYSAESIYLYALLDYPTESIGAYTFEYEWRVDQILLSGEKIPVDLTTDTEIYSSSLLIPADFLQPNFNYEIYVTVNSVGISNETVFKTIFVDFPLAISIIEAGNRQISSSKELIIDASNSIQHNDLFTWECFDLSTDLPCTDSTGAVTSVIMLNTSSLVQNVSPNTLETGGSYLFRLTQSSSFHSVTLSVVNQDVPLIYVSPIIFDVVSQGVFVLSSRVYGSGDITSVHWQSEQLEGQGSISLTDLQIKSVFYPSTQPTPVNQQTETVIYTSQWNELNLFLPTDSLSLHQNYTFSVNIQTNTNSNYKSSITLYNSFTPILGQLLISNSVAQPINSEITLDARDFSGSSLTYEFYYTYNTFRIPIQPRSVIATAKFIPPLFTTTQSTSITIYVAVYNALNKAITASKPFTIAKSIGNAETKITSLIDTTNLLINNKEFNKAYSRLSALFVSEFYNSMYFPTNSTDSIFTMLNNLSYIPIIPAYSGAYIDLIRYLRVDQLTSDKHNDYMRFLQRVVKTIFSAMDTVRSTPTRSFPYPTIVSFDRTTVSLLLQSIHHIPMAPDLDSTLLFSILDEISKILCLTTFFGSQAVTMSITGISLYFSNGYMYSDNDYCSGNDCQINSIQFPSDLTQQFHDWDCNTNSLYKCNGLCSSFYFVRLTEFTGSSTVKLGQTAESTINASNLTRTGFYFNFQATSLLTEILLLQLNNPISADNIEFSDRELTVSFAVTQNQLNGNGLILCLYRLDQSSEWEVESFFTKNTQTIDPNNINCRYTHFTQYALARLNYLPIITQPTTPAPTTSMNTTTRAPITTTQAPIKSEFPVAVAIIPIILLVFIILAIVIVLVVIYCLWKRNRIRIEELITPSEDDKVSEESIKTTDGMFFNICVLSKDGEQDNIGKLQFLPSSRLREIRNSLLDSFPEHFEKKAFCFLTKQGEQIDPGTENNHFLRIVYDTEVFVTFIDPREDAFRTVFCCCGKIAFFECSRCHGQAYCSAECQLTDWDLHKSECYLLTERKKRQDVLRKTQSSVIRTSVDLKQKRELEMSQPQNSQKYDTWKAFLHSQSGSYEVNKSLSIPIPIREHPTLNIPELTREKPRLRSTPVLPLPPIISTIQHPIDKPPS